MRRFSAEITAAVKITDENVLLSSDGEEGAKLEANS
jgi:hypothetical protein